MTTVKERSQWVGRGYLLFLFSAVYLYPFLRVLWRVGDEGMIVYGAQLVAEGALPYRDFFEMIGPLSFYWLGLFFKLFGTHWLVARALLLLTGAVTTILIYWMTRRVYRGPYDMLPAVFYLIISIPLWPATSIHWDSNLFALLAVGAFFLWQDTGRPKYLPVAGAIAGLTSGFIQQKGLFLLLAFLLVQLVYAYRGDRTKVRILVLLCLPIAGYAGVMTLTVLYFFLAGGLSDLIYGTFLFPLSRYHNINVVPYGFGLFDGLFELYRQSWLSILEVLSLPAVTQILGVVFFFPFLVIVALPILIVVVTALCCIRTQDRHRIFNSTALPYWGCGIALWISEIHRMDILHLIYGSPLLLIVLFMVWNTRSANGRALGKLGLAMLTLCLLSFGTFNVLIASSANHRLETRRGTIYSFKDDAALRFLHGLPAGENVFVYPYYPMYYFLANVRNPTRYSILLYHYNSEEQFNETITALERDAVKYVLWDTLWEGHDLTTRFPQYKHPPKEQLHLERYIEDHYQPKNTLNGFRMMVRPCFRDGKAQHAKETPSGSFP